MKKFVALFALLPVTAFAHVPSSPTLGMAEGRCRAGESGPSFIVTATGLKDRGGTMKVELYPANDRDFLQDDNILINTGKAFRRVVIDVPSTGPVQLCIRAPGPGTWALSLLHDRDWHIYWDDDRQAIFKRLDRGEMVAQCSLSAGPNAGKGRHQDLDQFKTDLKKALGDRFLRFVGEGEVEGAAAGNFRHKVSVQGKQGDSQVLWHYYLIAAPNGDQVIATFTLGLAQQAQFAEQDLRLIGTFEWK